MVYYLLSFFHLLLSTRFPAASLFNLSCLCRLASRLELGSQEGSTTDHLYSCSIIQHTEDLRTIKADILSSASYGRVD